MAKKKKNESTFVPVEIDEDLNKEVSDYIDNLKTKKTQTKTTKEYYKMNSEDPANISFSNFDKEYTTYYDAYSSMFDAYEDYKLQQKQAESEAYNKAQQAKRYYEANKDTLKTDRTNKLIYSWDLNQSGGLRYNYNNSIDANSADTKTALGINDLSVSNFLTRDEEKMYQKKAEEWNKKQSLTDTLTDTLTNISPSMNNSTNINLLDPTKKTNPYENYSTNGYYKRYIEKFNEALNKNNIKAANNALEAINSKYFGADYDDSMLSSITNGITGYKDATTLETRFNNNVEKLNAINSSINNGVDNDTLSKLQNEKSKLEFENQLIQYNRLVSIYSNQQNIREIDTIMNNIEEPFKNISFDFEWNKNKNVIENTIDNFNTLVNGVTQVVSATGNAIMEGSFNSVNSLLTNNFDEGLEKDLASGILDFASYLVPYVGQAKLWLDTASESGVAIPGVMNIISDGADYVGLDFKKQKSAKLGGDEPNLRQTVGSALYIAMNFVLDDILKKTPLSKFSFDDKTKVEIAKMTYGNVLKSMVKTGLSEGAEEFVQAYAEEMVYGDQSTSPFNKETFNTAFRNFVYAFLVSEGVSGVQVGTSKLAYKNSLTTDTVYTQVSSPKKTEKTEGSSKVNITKVEDLTTTIDSALTEGKTVTIGNVNVEQPSTIMSGIEISNTDVTDVKVNNVLNNKIDATSSISIDESAFINTNDLTKLQDILNNPKYLEANSLPNNPTINQIYDLLTMTDSELAFKVSEYADEYGNKTISKFIDDMSKELSRVNKPSSNDTSIDLSNQAIKDSTNVIISPNTETTTYLKTNNPNAEVITIDPKSATYESEINDFVTTRAKDNLVFTENTKTEVFKPTSKDIDYITKVTNDIRNKSIKLNDDSVIEPIMIPVSVISTGDATAITDFVQQSFLDDVAKGLYSNTDAKAKYKELSNMLNLYMRFNKNRTTIKDTAGNNVIFEKTGTNTYRAPSKVDPSNAVVALVKTSGKVIYGNSGAKLNLPENAINRVNKLIQTLNLKGDLLTKNSSGKDVLELVNKNKDMSKEILQALGYDGLMYGDKVIKYISSEDNVDTVNEEKLAKNTDKQIENLIKDKNEVVATAEIKSVVNTIKTKNPEVNRVRETITDVKLNAPGQSDTNTTPASQMEFSANERYAIEKWSGKSSYLINDSLRKGYSLDKRLSNIHKTLEKILDKIPSTSGTFSRSINFETKAELYDFLTKYQEGHTVIEKAFTSMSNKDVYDESFNVQMQITTNTAKDVSELMRSNEHEVMLNTNTAFKVDKVRIKYTEDGKHVAKAFLDLTTVDLNNKASNSVNTPINDNVEIKIGDKEFKGDPEMYDVDTIEALSKIEVKNKKAEKTFKNSLDKIYEMFIDRLNPIAKRANSISDISVKNAMREYYAIGNKVYNNINAAQTDNQGKPIGDSINKIKSMVKKEDLNDFNNYMRLMLNAERLQNDMPAIINKFSAEQSLKAADKILKRKPYFKSVAEKIKTYNVNTNAKLVDAGLITQAQADGANAKYQYYFPVFSAEAADFVDIGTPEYSKRLEINDTMKETTNAGVKILDIWTAMGNKEYMVESSIAKNGLVKAIATSDTNIYSGKHGTLLYYDNGQIKKAKVHGDIVECLEQRPGEVFIDKVFSLPGLKWLPGIKKIQKKMLTGLDPIYQANNLIRDYMDSALIHSKYKTKFSQNYVRAIQNVASNSALYVDLQQKGVVPMNTGKNVFTRTLQSLEGIPKMAEYLSAIQSGKSDLEARIDAQDVNLNFARGGWLTQKLDSKGFIFLNASFQGFDKVCSTTKDLVKGAKTPKGAMRLILTVGAASAPGVLNAIINADDDDYNKLPHYYKNNYYFIKLGNGNFLRIPKGRVVGTVDTITRYASGVSTENTLGEYYTGIKESAQTSILPAELLESAPWSELSQIASNKNFYGGEIYDENGTFTDKALDTAGYMVTNIFGRYGKAAKYLLDGDPTTDVWQTNGYIFDATKYDKNMNTVFNLRDQFQAKKKSGELSFEEQVQKKYIDGKVYAINAISGEINQGKKDGLTVQDMSDLYQERSALTQDTIDNYKNYEVYDSPGGKMIVFDDVTYTYDETKKEFRKNK